MGDAGEVRVELPERRRATDEAHDAMVGEVDWPRLSLTTLCQASGNGEHGR